MLNNLNRSEIMKHDTCGFNNDSKIQCLYRFIKISVSPTIKFILGCTEISVNVTVKTPLGSTEFCANSIFL